MHEQSDKEQSNIDDEVMDLLGEFDIISSRKGYNITSIQIENYLNEKNIRSYIVNFVKGYK
ncbi:MAG TPA: hypothetical protein VKR58_15135 [Aquella sp.]|nr:hypothetical protein [Aquella sp.]